MICKACLALHQG